MGHLFMSLLALIAVFLAFTYAYYLLHRALTITKCPDCGRIMQKVMYTDLLDERQKHVHYECRFCQSKRINKGSMPNRRKSIFYP